MGKKERDLQSKIKELGGKVGAIGVNFDLAKIYQEKKRIVKSVIPNSPAQKSGVKPGDWIQKYSAGKRGDISLNKVAGHPIIILAGETVTLTIIRNGQEQKVVLVAASREELFQNR